MPPRSVGDDVFVLFGALHRLGPDASYLLRCFDTALGSRGFLGFVWDCFIVLGLGFGKSRSAIAVWPAWGGKILAWSTRTLRIQRPGGGPNTLKTHGQCHPDYQT